MYCVRPNELCVRQGREVQLPEELRVRQVEGAEVAPGHSAERSRWTSWRLRSIYVPGSRPHWCPPWLPAP